MGNLVYGLGDLVDALSDLGGDLTNCGVTASFAEAMAVLYAEFYLPEIAAVKYAYDFLWYGTTLVAKIDDSSTNWSNGDYFGFGEDLGGICAILVPAY